MTDNTLESYFKNLGKNKLLTREDEVVLSQQIESGSAAARKKMIESNLRLAISIAKRHQRPGFNLEDLIQESNIGLIKAVDRFDWRRGFKFSTYASWWIKQSVKRYITNTRSDIRVPAHATALAWRISVFVDEYEREFCQKPSCAEIADMMGVSEDMIDEVLRGINAHSVISLDAMLNDDNSKKILETVADDNICDPGDIIDRNKLLAVINNSLSQFTPREEQILRLRFGMSTIENSEEFEVNVVAS